MFSAKMTPTERQAVLSLATIMSLRMMGIFMVLPVFSLHAKQLVGATPFLIGLAIGVYGLSQAFLQIPFGSLSDVIGRKSVITAGLIIFIIGSVLAAFSNSIAMLIFARALQGAGAVGSTILALLADLTREEQRSKAMAIAGITIGFSFSIAMLMGPIITQWIHIPGLFFTAALLSFCGIVMLFYFVPTPKTQRWHRDTQPSLRAFLQLLVVPELMTLNLGIFLLHAIFTASFVVLPISLQQLAHIETTQQWEIYLPTLLAAFVISIFFIGLAEKKQQLKRYFLLSILALLVAEINFLFIASQTFFTFIGISLFFIGFSILEAFLPSFISRIAPSDRKGSALGLYSCAQFLGIFAGGVLGGLLYGKYAATGVYLACIFLSLLWFLLARRMRYPSFLVNQILVVPSFADWSLIKSNLQSIPGMREIIFIAEENLAYLKMEKAATNHPLYIQLKQELHAQMKRVQST